MISENKNNQKRTEKTGKNEKKVVWKNLRQLKKIQRLRTKTSSCNKLSTISS